MATDRDRIRAEEYKDEWVVDGATRRVVRREAVSLAAKVRERLADAMSEGALALDPEEADLRAVAPRNAPAEVAEPIAPQPRRPREAAPAHDAKEFNREHRRV